VVTVLSMLGGRIAEAVGAVPGVSVVVVPHDGPLDDDVRGDVLFAAIRTPNLLPLAARVQWVQLSSTGVDGVAHELFDVCPMVTCARGASAVPIAEWVLAMVLAFEKRVPDVWLRAARGPDDRRLRLGEVAGKTLGVVGLGGIGTAVARRALAFDMKVVAVRRRVDVPSPLDGVQIVGSLEELLPLVDHLVLAAPATAASAGMIDARALSLVKPGVHIVNIARGALVDQDALRVALDDGRVACASLDAVTPEPLPPEHWMYTHPGVRLSPHVSWSSPLAMDRLLAIFLDNLRRWQAGEPLHGIVDASEGY
jgi:phosphoglycerate dehydrogenase-like enzyme